MGNEFTLGSGGLRGTQFWSALMRVGGAKNLRCKIPELRRRFQGWAERTIHTLEEQQLLCV